ncbi:peptidoglycan D,D-transpeptidase FtsI family protein [Xylanibacillus composti]|uniref:Penicillin-binding protein 4B n=1 Tax=Xylanibacillus composti TaxID=1572762 RepID=A0A8J4H7M3_9BACL|nr:penicillin-binding protein 2 [Xylanibacillus composti]GIQ71501.1 penicillin-binding protein 4B [Xylanibacillus composti]
MQPKRIFWTLLIFAMVMTTWLGRLAWIQLAAPVDWTHAAVRQREQSIVLHDGRGDFADRYGEPLTGQVIHAAAVFPVRDASRSDELDRFEVLAEILGEPATVRGDVPFLWQRSGDVTPVAMTEEQRMLVEQAQLVGVQIVPYSLRYAAPFPAAHVIGFISQHPQMLETLYADELRKGTVRPDQKIGASGLERTLEPIIRGRTSEEIAVHVNGNGELLKGLGVRMQASANPYYPLKVTTTLDRGQQLAVERVMDESGHTHSSAVVVLDAKDGDIRVMASRPSYHPLQVNPAGEDWRNRAIAAETPGSIMKLAVAAAVWEHGTLPDSHLFECNGHFGAYGLSCWKTGGHGKLTLEEAIAHSCNVALAQAMLSLTPQQFEETAAKLGLGQQVGPVWERGSGESLRLLDHEQAGLLYAAPHLAEDEGARVQTAIGQRDARMSPLQAAVMLQPILHDGKLLAPQLIKDIRYANGTTAYRIKEESPVRDALSRQTARQLRKALEKAVNEGTGRALADMRWPAAGKSGTAQTGAHKEKEHHWFAGYVPVEQPRYIIAAVVYDQPPGSVHQGVRLFRKVAEALMSADEQGANRSDG